MRLTTPRSSRQDAPAAIDDLYRGRRARRWLSRSDLVHWHVADDVLAALKVRYGVGSSAARYPGECPDSGSPVAAARLGEDRFTIRFADLRHRHKPTIEFTTCALAKRLRANWILELDERGIA
jgi:hypothetical protein